MSSFPTSGFSHSRNTPSIRCVLPNPLTPENTPQSARASSLHSIYSKFDIPIQEDNKELPVVSDWNVYQKNWTSELNRQMKIIQEAASDSAVQRMLNEAGRDPYKLGTIFNEHWTKLRFDIDKHYFCSTHRLDENGNSGRRKDIPPKVFEEMKNAINDAAGELMKHQRKAALAVAKQLPLSWLIAGRPNNNWINKQPSPGEASVLRFEEIIQTIKKEGLEKAKSIFHSDSSATYLFERISGNAAFSVHDSHQVKELFLDFLEKKREEFLSSSYPLPLDPRETSILKSHYTQGMYRYFLRVLFDNKTSEPAKALFNEIFPNANRHAFTNLIKIIANGGHEQGLILFTQFSTGNFKLPTPTAYVENLESADAFVSTPPAANVSAGNPNAHPAQKLIYTHATPPIWGAPSKSKGPRVVPATSINRTPVPAPKLIHIPNIANNSLLSLFGDTAKTPKAAAKKKQPRVVRRSTPVDNTQVLTPRMTKQKKGSRQRRFLNTLVRRVAQFFSGAPAKPAIHIPSQRILPLTRTQSNKID